MRNTLRQPLRPAKELRNYPPCVWTPTEVYKHMTEGPRSKAPGAKLYVAARPMNGRQSLLGRVKLALAVFRGQADVLQWEQGQ